MVRYLIGCGFLTADEKLGLSVMVKYLIGSVHVELPTCMLGCTSCLSTGKYTKMTACEPFKKKNVVSPLARVVGKLSTKVHYIFTSVFLVHG